MTKYDEHIATFKEQLVSAKALVDPWTYFMDHLGESHGFHKLGRRGQSSTLELITKSIIERIIQRSVSLETLNLVYLPEAHFYHGACAIPELVANVAFFDDIDVGLVTIALARSDGQCYFARFSTVAMAHDTPFVFVPSPTDTIQ